MNDDVVPAKAGTHNPRRGLLREAVVTPFLVSTSACGYGSRISTRSERSSERACPGRQHWSVLT